MTKPIKRMILIIIIAIAFMLMACDNSQVNHWSKSDGGTCYSTLQPGCLDALMGWEE
jgi:hypothetical protein